MRVKFIHTIHTLQIGDYSRLEATGDLSLISRILLPLPNIYLKKRFLSLQLDIAKLFKRDNLLDKEVYRLYLYNKLVLLEAVYTALTIGRKSKLALEYFESNYGPYTKLADLEPLRIELKRVTSKYNEAQKEAEITNEKRKENDKKSGNFETVIAYVELILDRSVPRTLTMYEFKHLYDLAVRKSEANKTKKS